MVAAHDLQRPEKLEPALLGDRLKGEETAVVYMRLGDDGGYVLHSLITAMLLDSYPHAPGGDLN